MIVGVAPSRLIYTQGLTTLVLLPFWILFLSLLAMTFIFIASQLKVFVFGLLNWLHIHRTPKKEKEHLSGTFFIIRLIFLPIVMMTLAHALQWYGQKVHLGNMSIGITQSDDDADENKKKNGDTDVDNADNVEVVAESVNDNESDKTSVGESKDGIFDGEIGEVDKAIARFVYSFETFEGSRCVLAPGERAVPINENDILVVIRDKSTELGFKFSSRACELKSEASAEQINLTEIVDDAKEVGQQLN